MVEIRILPLEPVLTITGKHRYLVITDVHLGFESNIISKDIHLGKESMARKSAHRILNLIKKSHSDSLVLLGDVKSGTKKITDFEWRNVPQFFDDLGDIETILVPGNHDGNISKLIPKNITISSQSGVVIEQVLLTHGHAMPSEKFGTVHNIVMGHVHPAYSKDDSILNGQPVWVYLMAKREKIFAFGKGNIGITIMPPFNEYLYYGGKRSYSKSTSPIVRRALDGLESAKIISMDGAILGDESDIDAVL
ncbi:MAG: phosphoesterase [Cenarchaeum symbiont of Oopsacas minuta]|nr:phosphoesterase [Cenarchaeum symbiont of Oopsacas minuta]